MKILGNNSAKIVATAKSANNINNKQNKNTYSDPLKKWPVKGLAYSNELGAVVSGISPKLGTALWVPALMYFGADIYDKYKNDETSYKPSKRRGVKEAVFQALASVVMPTSAVAIGQRTISSLNRITKTGLSTQAKMDVIEKSLNYMESKSLHTFEQKPHEYVQGFKDAIIRTAKDTNGWYHIDIQGNAVYNQRYQIVEPFYNGFALVTDFYDNKLIINEKGEKILCV